MLEGRKLPAALLALLLGASPAFAITGDRLGGEPEAPMRSEPARPAEPSSLVGSAPGYVGYDASGSVPSSAVELPQAAAAAEAGPVQAEPPAALEDRFGLRAMNPVASPGPRALERLSPAVREAARELQRHTIILTDGEPTRAVHQPDDVVSHEFGHRLEPESDRYDYYSDMPLRMSGSWYAEEPSASRSEPMLRRSGPRQLGLPLEGGQTRSRNVARHFPDPEGLPAPDRLTLQLPFGERRPEAPIPGAERLKAIRAAFRADRERLTAFWKRRTGILIKAAGDEFPLTFSLDTELGVADAFRTIIADETTKAELDSIHKGVYDKDTLAFLVGLKARQLEPFALRPEVEKGRDAYRLTDLRADYYARAVKTLARPSQETLKDLAGRAAAALGQPVVATLDSLQKTAPLVANNESWDIELSHRSWEEIPWLFAALIRRLHESLAAPQTHLHIGLPSANGKDANVAVARAMETLMILDLASAPPSSLARQGFDATVLSKAVYDRVGDHRGLVNFTYVEWTIPHETDNLELRYYPDIETGLRWLAMAAELARNHKRLRVYPEFDVKDKIRRAVPDELTVNLAGALKYASLMLGDSGGSDDHRVAADLRLLSRRVEEFLASSDAQFMALPMELREEIAEYLRSHRVQERMTVDRFLRPARSR